MMQKPFLDHPRKVDETYLGHMGFALRFAGLLMLASLAALVHALIPAFCEHSASSIVRDLEARTRGRRPPEMAKDCREARAM